MSWTSTVFYGGYSWKKVQYRKMEKEAVPVCGGPDTSKKVLN